MITPVRETAPIHLPGSVAIPATIAVVGIIGGIGGCTAVLAANAQAVAEIVSTVIGLAFLALLLLLDSRRRHRPSPPPQASPGEVVHVIRVVDERGTVAERRVTDTEWRALPSATRAALTSGSLALPEGDRS